MLGLPKNTEMQKQIPKTAVYSVFNMSNAEKEAFDLDISRLFLVAELSPNTLHIDAGETVSGIFVMHVLLKRKNYDEKTILKLLKLINQNLLLVLDFESQRRLAVFCTRLIQSEWKASEDWSITLNGLNLDTVWDNIITQVGSIQLEEDHTIAEQIAVDDRKAKLQKEIARLEKQARAEKQPKKKFELLQRINSLKSSVQQ